jgi:hypothetical protein
MLREIARAYEADIDTVVILKGSRQVGGTTLMDALTLFWMQYHEGMVGSKVVDSDENLVFRRDVMLQMLNAMPRSHRWPTRLSNNVVLAWGEPNHSRLVFAAAGKRQNSTLGRSRGLSFADCDEVGLWPDQRAVSALRASFSEKHPHRLFVFNGTAVGDTVWKDMCQGAERALGQHFVFISWWQREDYQLTKGTELFDAYALAERTEDERFWIDQVLTRYGHVITDAQLGWFRWQLAEKFLGDEDSLFQEYGPLPEMCFVAFGDKFFDRAVLRRMRVAQAAAPVPTHLRVEWTRYFDEVRVLETAPELGAPLTIWEQPQDGAMYIVGGKSGYSDNPEQPQDAAVVFRLYPDTMVQVAEYCTEESDPVRFAWLLLYLCGVYKTATRETYLAVEAGGTGRTVVDELRRMGETNYGVSPTLRRDARRLFDFSGMCQHYLYRRPDSLRGNMALHWQTTPSTRPMLLHGLKGQILRGEVEVQSTALLDELEMVRRGGDGQSNDTIGGAGGHRDGRVIATALAVRHYLDAAVHDVVRWIEPKTPRPQADRTVAQVLVQNWLHHRVLSGRR